MKKLLFSAVALIAFSSVSMGNTYLKSTNSVVKVSKTPCADQWAEDVEVLQNGLSATLDEAMEIADACFEECLNETYGSN